MKIFTRSFFVLLICTLVMTSCKKENPFGPDLSKFAGSWTETPVSPDYQRRLFFSIDGTFVMHFTYYGNTAGITSNGTYSVNGDKLTATIKKQVVSETKKQPVITTVDQSLFDEATFTIIGNELTINFLTYPADGPVPTTLKFLKN